MFLLFRSLQIVAHPQARQNTTTNTTVIIEADHLPPNATVALLTTVTAAHMEVLMVVLMAVVTAAVLVVVLAVAMVLLTVVVMAVVMVLPMVVLMVVAMVALPGTLQVAMTSRWIRMPSTSHLLVIINSRRNLGQINVSERKETWPTIAVQTQHP